MQKYKFSELTDLIVRSLVNLRRETSSRWDASAAMLSEKEKDQITLIKNRLQSENVSRLNETTVWGRAVYPLLMLSENGLVKTWADEPLAASFVGFTLEGIADGIISEDEGGNPRLPYLVVIEGKKGIDAKDPQPQLYGAMLAAAKLNWDEKRNEPQLVYGCYTIADTWTFLRGELNQLESAKPNFKVEASREYIERFEAETILGILKTITATNEQN